jgi:diguanylate cyclase (GGDEF)-like protein
MTQLLLTSVPQRRLFKFAIILVLTIACTAWLPLSQQSLKFERDAQSYKLALIELQYQLTETLSHPIIQEIEAQEIASVVYQQLSRWIDIEDVFLISDEGYYYQLNKGNPVQDYFVTEDDADYASELKSFADEPVWSYYFLSNLNARIMLWNDPTNNARLWITLPSIHRSEQWIVSVSVLPDNLFHKISETDLILKKRSNLPDLVTIYQFDLNDHWVFLKALSFPWLYTLSICLLMIPVYVFLSKKPHTRKTEKIQEDFLQFIYDELNVLVFEVDDETNVKWTEGQLSNETTLFNIKTGDTLYNRLKTQPRFLAYLKQSQNGERLTYEIDEGAHRLRVHHWPLKNQYHRVSGVGFFIQDISNQRDLEQQLQHSQFHDTLTGLPNRQLFLEQLQHGLLRAKRRQEFTAVLAMEISGIGHINKLHGHEVSDLLIKNFVTETKTVLRTEDTLCRFSADEFLIGLDDYHQPDELRQIAERLIEKTTESFLIEGHHLRLTVNIGIATYPRDAKDAGSLVSNAITAMRHARQTGRNTLDYFSADNARLAHDKWQLEQDITNAVNAHDFTLHYQPIFDLSTNQCTGAEALIRWPSTDLGPDQFIPLAEQSGLIHSIGLWVIEAALTQFTEWKSAGSSIEYLSINLSVSQLESPSFFDNLDEILRRLPLNEGKITLEITESVMMQTSQTMMDKLDELKKRGFYLAIDDFGTGFSSLNYLKHLPVDYLKMDRSFVSGIPSSPHDMVICEAIIQLAVAMGLQIIAEGVETPQQMKWLNEHGVESAQGYFYAKAVPASEFSIYLGHLEN